VVIKKHWLHGDIKFNVDVTKETRCGKCSHWRVCKMDMEEFCLNYTFGTSQGKRCGSCLHRHTRYDRDEHAIPCFKCKHFNPINKEEP